MVEEACNSFKEMNLIQFMISVMIGPPCNKKIVLDNRLDILRNLLQEATELINIGAPGANNVCTMIISLIEALNSNKFNENGIFRSKNCDCGNDVDRWAKILSLTPVTAIATSTDMARGKSICQAGWDLFVRIGEIIVNNNTGINSINTVNAQTVIGQINQTLINDGNQQATPIEILRHHTANAPANYRREFLELEKELTATEPNKPKVAGILASLGGLLGNVAACAEAISKISDVVQLIS